MKKLLLILVVLLSACTTAPVTQKMPVLPEELTKTCKPLTIIEGETTTLTELMKTVAKNYSSRHECAAQLEAVQEWYADQKKIFDKANK